MLGQATNHINGYRCAENHILVTKEVDSGTTPYQVKCAKCGRWARSMFYSINPTMKPTHEWYKPTDLDSLRDDVREYVEKGGLLLRRI
jgi:hypothetical protein